MITLIRNVGSSAPGMLSPCITRANDSSAAVVAAITITMPTRQVTGQTSHEVGAQSRSVIPSEFERHSCTLSPSEDCTGVLFSLPKSILQSPRTTSGSFLARGCITDVLFVHLGSKKYSFIFPTSPI